MSNTYQDSSELAREAHAIGAVLANALTTAQTAALTTTGVAALHTDQTANLTTAQLAALCANNDQIVSILKSLTITS